MKILEKTSDGLKRCYSVLITPDELEQSKVEKLREIAKKVKLDGFRPGKVPLDIVRRMYGDGIESEAKQAALDFASQRVVKDESLAVSFRIIKEIVKEDENGLEFKMKFELLPNFELRDWSGIKLTKYCVDVTDADADKLLEEIRSKHKKWVEDLPSEKIVEGQKVTVDLKLLTKVKKHKDDKIENLEIVVGDNSLVDDFWKHLIGAQVGDTLEFDISYPENFGDKGLAGKKVRYSANIKKICRAEEFKLDDDFAVDIGYESLEKAREWARTRVSSKYSNISRDIMKRHLLEQLVEDYDFEVPNNMISVEEEEVVRQIKVEAKKMGKEFSPEIEKECRNIAIERVRLGFIVTEIAKKENISVSKAEMVRAIQNIAMMHPGREKAIFDMYHRHPEAAGAIVGPALENKVVKFMLDKLSPNEQKCTAEQLIAIDEEPFDFFKEPTEKEKAKKSKPTESKPKADEKKSKSDGTKKRTRTKAE